MAYTTTASATKPAGAYSLPVRAFLYWLPLAFSVTVLSGLVYVAVQQDLRQGANDPQIQIAQDAAAQLEAGRTPQEVVGPAKVDMARSLAPFLIVYDRAGHLIAASVQLDGETPTIPAGVFKQVRQSGEDRLSWQPQSGVRSATIVTAYGGSNPGFVLAGRSLLEVEKREAQLTQEVAAAWIVAMVGSLLAWAIALGLINRLR